MGYTPPQGWVEEVTPSAENAFKHKSSFHERLDCPRIASSEALRPVDRPYSAARCRLCAA